MAKVPVSLTLAEENLVWLKGHAVKKGASLSSVLDDLVLQARTGRRLSPAQPRSVVGTIDLPAGDPSLENADAAIRELFSASLARPLIVRETSPRYGTRGPRRRTGRG